jgi:tRNA-binding EMAP/Myf-like protein
LVTCGLCRSINPTTQIAESTCGIVSWRAAHLEVVDLGTYFLEFTYLFESSKFKLRVSIGMFLSYQTETLYLCGILGMSQSE